jgi:hypothetical protein
MDALEADVIAVLTPAAAYGLGLLFPAIPPAVWSAIFTALKNGDLNAAALCAFLAEHNIKVYTTDQPGDVTPIFPIQKNSGVNQT